MKCDILHNFTMFTGSIFGQSLAVSCGFKIIDNHKYILRGLLRSKCYSTKTGFLCIMCTLYRARCSNKITDKVCTSILAIQWNFTFARPNISLSNCEPCWHYSSVSDGDDEKSSPCQHRPFTRRLVPEHILRFLHQQSPARLTVQLPALHRGICCTYLWLVSTSTIYT